MDILGILLVVVGLILLVAARGIYKGGEKTTQKYKEVPEDNDAFLMLLSNGMIVLRIIGLFMMVVGSLLIVI